MGYYEQLRAQYSNYTQEEIDAGSFVENGSYQPPDAKELEHWNKLSLKAQISWIEGAKDPKHQRLIAECRRRKPILDSEAKRRSEEEEARWAKWRSDRAAVPKPAPYNWRDGATGWTRLY